MTFVHISFKFIKTLHSPFSGSWFKSRFAKGRYDCSSLASNYEVQRAAVMSPYNRAGYTQCYSELGKFRWQRTELWILYVASHSLMRKMFLFNARVDDSVEYDAKF